MPARRKSEKSKSVDLDQISNKSLSAQDKNEKKTAIDIPPGQEVTSKSNTLLSMKTMKKKATNKVAADIKKKKSALMADDENLGKAKDTNESRGQGDMENEKKEPDPVNLEITTSRGALSPKGSQSKSPITNDKDHSKPSKSPKHIKTPGSKSKSPRPDGDGSHRSRIKAKKHSKADKE